MKKSKDYNISDKDKKIIDTFLEKYQDNQYFLDSLFNDMDSDDILEYVDESDCYRMFGDDLLYEFGDDELSDYLTKQGYLVQDKDGAIDLSDDSIENQMKLINTVCENITHRYLTKEEKKKEICDFIDFWFC